MKGQCTGGGLALGYKIAPDKSFMVDQEQAKVVQTIFDMFIKGTSNADICQYLNNLGLRTSRGNVFSNSSITRIIKNEKYIGIYHCGDIHLEDAVPKIIEKEVFYLAQQELARRTTHRRTSALKAEYLLSGKLFCGHCKKPMIGVSGTGKSGKKFYYYYCGTARKTKRCDKKQVPKDWLETLVVQETLKHILQPEVIKYIAQRCYKLQLADKKETEDWIFLARKISDNKKAIAHIVRAVEAGAASETLLNRLRELEFEQVQLQKELKILESYNSLLTPEQIEFMLSQYADLGADSDEYKAQIINTFVSEVYLYDDKALLYYNIRKEETKLSGSALALIEKTPLNGGLGSTAKGAVFDYYNNASINIKQEPPQTPCFRGFLFYIPTLYILPDRSF